MINLIVSTVQSVAQDVRAGAGVAATTTTTGTMTWLEMIPTDIGKLATVIGIILSTVLIWTHLEQRAHKQAQRIEEKERHDLEMEVLTAELKSHKAKL